MPVTLAEFNRRFRIVPTSLFNWPRNRSGDAEPTGDCQDYAKSVKAIEGVKFPRAIVIRCWSPHNWKPPFLPRHAVLWIKGKGFIDSTVREYRRWPLPHVPAWPVGTPAIVAAVLILWPWL